MFREMFVFSQSIYSKWIIKPKRTKETPEWWSVIQLVTVKNVFEDRHSSEDCNACLVWFIRRGFKRK